MNEKKENLSFDEREFQKNRRKKHVENKKTKKSNKPKIEKKVRTKVRKAKPNHRLMDYDSEAWYD